MLLINISLLNLNKQKVLYNLPNGKTIYLTIEEYLNLTDDDIQYLIAIRAGNTLPTFFDSALHDKPLKVQETSDEVLDTDYLPDDLKDDDVYRNYSYEEDYDDIDFSDPSDI